MVVKREPFGYAPSQPKYHGWDVTFWPPCTMYHEWDMKPYFGLKMAKINIKWQKRNSVY